MRERLTAAGMSVRLLPVFAGEEDRRGVLGLDRANQFHLPRFFLGHPTPLVTRARAALAGRRQAWRHPAG
jgi:hypothetical protein